MSIALDEKSIKNIELIDKLRERFSPEENRKLKLPQIIVVGDQSSGKSSLLEAISGIKLPKGVKTVTRCPIIIQMKKSENQRTRIMYINADNKKVEKIITDTEKEIREVQKCVFGDKMTKEPITIIAESPNLNTLTMIDLPGIIKTETTDHVTAAKEKTLEIAKFYMKQENSLIICVLPANQDICTTTTIGLAEECNTDKSRIIVALTKLDKLDQKEETLIPDILSNRKLHIEKGFFGLIVSDDILEASFNERSELENEKLQALYFWKDYKERLGLKRFESVLVRELNCLIDKTLPILKRNIYNLIKETEHELSISSKYNDNKELQYTYIIECQKDIDRKIEVILCKADEEIMKFPCMKKYLIDKHLLNLIKEDDTFLYFWNQIFKALLDTFNSIYTEIYNRPSNSPTSLEVRIKRSQTENSSFFISPKVFTHLVDEILKKFEEKTYLFLEKCYQFIEHMADTVLIMDIETELDSLKTDIQIHGKEVIKRQKHETYEHLKYLFKSEKSYFYQDSSFAVQTMVGDYQHGILLQQYLHRYVTALIGRLGIVIPNFIRLSLFYKFKEELNQLLILQVFHPEIYPFYFDTSEQKEEEYCKLKKTLANLKESAMELDPFGSKRFRWKIPKK